MTPDTNPRSGAPRRVAVVTGGNRGIGKEICRQLAQAGLHVVLTSRDEGEGRRAAQELSQGALAVTYQPLDVTSDKSRAALCAALRRDYDGLDILVNNAGISMQGFNAEVARTTIEVNFFGALHTTDLLLPLVRGGGRIVMVSSGMADRRVLSPALRERFGDPRLGREELVGRLRSFVAEVARGTHEQEGWPSSAYRVSKIGLNALMAVLDRELKEAGDPRGILCNAADPGWVRTRMGGPGAPRSVEQGADTPVWLATLPPGGPSGGIFANRRPASW